MQRFSGVAASPGLARGRVFLVDTRAPEVTRREIGPGEVAGELARFEAALSTASEELRRLRDKTAKEAGEEEAAIFDAHLMFLEDPSLVDEIRGRIEGEHLDAEFATHAVSEMLARQFEGMEDEYFAARAADIRDVGRRIVRVLQGAQDTGLDLPADAVVVAVDLAPSDTAAFPRDRLRALVTEMGSKTSHTAILARTLGIPAVTGVRGLLERVTGGEPLLVDGQEGTVILSPGDEELSRFEELLQRWEERRQRLAALKDAPAVSRDGHRVELAANIGSPDDMPAALEAGAEGVGLFRSEFLFIDRDAAPTEEEQAEAYRRALAAMPDGLVIIRTLDIGGDKLIPYLDLPEELNPFLGYRALRLCLDRRELFLTQLRAILRASDAGRPAIMFPMVTGLAELQAAKEALAEARRQLEEDGVSMREEIPVGIMVEIPAAAAIADLLAPHVDFFSIGTNDLVQYTLAVDRTNDRVAHLADYFHPAVLRLIRQTIEAGHGASKWTGMCGEMAGDPLATPVLLGLGLDEFSMSAGQIGAVKEVVRAVSVEECRRLADELLQLARPEDIRKKAAEFLAARGIEVGL